MHNSWVVGDFTFHLIFDVMFRKINPLSQCRYFTSLFSDVSDFVSYWNKLFNEPELLLESECATY